ncbi:MAG TPA: pilus assembly protein N-terminal domain-containing protein, partial [Caulobacteraceae bacterium]|nr:pilus assembly protein N-terminal domain-containing protein [Caulobacteraceae bacterium]
MTRSIGLLAVLAALAVAPAAALAQAAPASTIKVDLKGAAAQDLVLPKGKSAIIELPIDVRDAHVTDSAVADVELPYARRVYVMGIASGQTDAVFFDAAGRRILSLNIRVQPDLTGFAETVTRVAPSAHVEAEAVNDRVILTGHVANMADADKVMRVAASYVSKPENVLNMMTVTGKDQVLLKVRIVEMQRSVLKQFGISTDLLLREPGHLQFSYSNNATFPVNGTVQAGLNVTGTKLTGANNLNQTTAGIQAFERVGVVRTLAEPNLTAVSGESAKFLAGGEFPVPSAVDNAGRVTVTFKSFGVGLGFVPVVLSDGRISLKISTEVSDINPIGSF